MTHTTMYHPESGGIWDCPDDVVEEFKAKGWVDAEDSSPPKYDPADHSVKEVLAYIEEHPDDADRVLEAEAAGKNRTSITGTGE
jgi:hypothetical protein